VFADAAARTAALGSPSEGMVTYLEDTDSLELYTTVWGPVSPAITRSDLPAGSVLQVVSTAKTDVYSAGVSGAGVFTGDVTGLTVTVTPTSSTSKVLVTVYVDASQSVDALTMVKLMRDGADTDFIGDADGARVRASSGRIFSINSLTHKHSFTYLDSPATTSAVTYSIRIATNAATTIFVNRSGNDPNNSSTSRSASSITVMEVAG